VSRGMYACMSSFPNLGLKDLLHTLAMEIFCKSVNCPSSSRLESHRLGEAESPTMEHIFCVQF
jgi:hypothetical protein